MKQFKFSVICAIFLLNSSAAGAQLMVNCQGTGPPVYLIGGGPAFTTWNLDPIQQQLNTNFRVCRWDMRGVGDNADQPIRQDTLVLQQWLQDMAVVLPEQPVVLWGHSWGALQSLLFARQYPERVRKLILSNPVDPQLASLEQIERKRFVHPYVQSKLEFEDYETTAEQHHLFRSKIASYFIDAKTGWEYSTQFDPGDSNNELNVKIWQEYRQMPLQQDELKQLSDKIALLIYCQQDVLMPENFQAYARMLPDVEYVMMKNCAHFPWVETPEKYYELLRQSLTE